MPEPSTLEKLTKLADNPPSSVRTARLSDAEFDAVIRAREAGCTWIVIRQTLPPGTYTADASLYTAVLNYKKKCRK